MLGFEAGLAAWRRVLKPDGQAAVTEPCWLEAGVPDRVRAHWAEYEAMTTVERSLERIGAAGYRPLGHFVLPDRSWWTDYYGPKEMRLEDLARKYAADPDALAEIERARGELDFHRRHGRWYGYVFFVMQRDR
jgi:hypothetical protein